MSESTIGQGKTEGESTMGQGKGSDLISRQKVLNIIDWVHYLYCFSPSEERIFDYLKGIIAGCEASTIDPVRHGEWIFDPDGIDWGIPAWVCSECHCRNSMIPTYICGKGQRIKVEHPLRWEGSKFCPNCGLPMQERNEDEAD